MSFLIRKALESDWPEIQDVLTGAFGDEEGVELIKLTADLLVDETAAPRLSMIAIDGDTVAGHILFTKVELRNSPRELSTSILAPLAIRPEHQRKGIGGSLISEGISRLRESGVDLVFVLGHPGYYPRHGFSPAGVRGLEAPYPIPPENADAWMVQELRSGVLKQVNSQVKCAEALCDPNYWRE